MSITSALGATLSGLTAASRRAETVSSNIANAATPGYARRRVELSSGLAGGPVPGVKVETVTRHQDVMLLSQRRESEASLAGADTRAGFLGALETAIGLPGQAGSLTDRLAGFEAALIGAASRPDSEARLLSAVGAADRVAGHLNTLSDHVQDARLQADRDISTAVTELNAALEQVVALNTRIGSMSGTTRDVASLLDARQVAIDGIAELMPVRQVARPNGAVALYTPGGAMLVEGKAAEFGFAPAPEMTVHRTLAGGGLSGLTLNGQPVATGADSGPIAGGRLAALFEVRDSLGPSMQAELDAVARNLIERFQDSGVDPTLGAGDAGLFTDAGAALDLAEEPGLAGRIAVNAAVDPAAGGAVWRLRDGIGEAAPGDAGSAAILNAMAAALADPRVPGSGSFTTPRGASGLAGDLLSQVSTRAFEADARVSFFRATTEALVIAELQDSVDTDQEMQELLLIEQAYAANARMMSVLDEMMQQLLRL